jgi:hypothetical protein
VWIIIYIFVKQIREIMKTTNTLPGFTYTPFTREDLVQSMLERKESGDCPVHDPNFYKPWDMVEVGTEGYNKELQKYDQVRKDRLSKKRMMRGK